MALTYTPEKNTEFTLPHFTLKDVFGKEWSSNEHLFNAQPTWVMFICNHCPYVKAIEDRLISTAKEALAKNINVIAICSNDHNDYPEDHPDHLRARALEKNYPFTYLIDEDQSVARTFGAVCTPDFFVFDQQDKLRYRGRLDDSWKDESKVNKRELADAMDALLASKPIETEIPSMGCSIKWSN